MAGGVEVVEPPIQTQKSKMSSSATTPIRGSSLLKAWSCLPHFRLEMTWETASPLLHGQNIVQKRTNVDWAASR